MRDGNFRYIYRNVQFIFNDKSFRSDYEGWKQGKLALTILK